MIWLAPWALLGLFATALPILIHLLGRGRAKTQRFPTLRFIERSRLLPTRRTRLHDLLLLLVRVAIVASAAVAMAQPYWRTATRRDAFGQTLARVVVLDTSSSVRRTLSADSTRAFIERLASEANVSVQLSSADIVSAIPGAVAWLTHQSERRELVIVSDFQASTIDAQALAQIPGDIGVQLLRVGTGANAAANAQPLEARARFGVNAVSARVTSGANPIEAGAIDPSPTATAIEWTVRSDTSPVQSNSVRVLASASQQSRANAALSAAISTSAEPVDVDSSYAIVIVTPGYERRAAIMATARVPKSQWILDAIVALMRDATLRDAASSATALASQDTSKGLVIARSSDGRALVQAFEASVDGRNTLVLVVDADAGSLATAALISAARGVIAPHHALGERDPTQLPDSVLRAWGRTPSAELRPTSGTADHAAASTDSITTDSSDGRWLWMLALALLALETWLRRRDRALNAATVAP